MKARQFISIVSVAIAPFVALAQQQPDAQNPIQPDQAAPPRPTQDVQDPQAVEAPPPPAQAAQFISLRVVGSTVRSTAGANLGRIEEVLVNPATGTIDFAVIATTGSNNVARLVPIPWWLLAHTSDQGLAGGLPGASQVFTADVEPARLAQAPVIERTRPPVRTASAAQAAINFFGARPVAAGSGGTGAGAVRGSGAAGFGNTTTPAAVPADGSTIVPQAGTPGGTAATVGATPGLVLHGVVINTNALLPNPLTNGTATTSVGRVTGVATNSPVPGAPVRTGAGPFAPAGGTSNVTLPRTDTGTGLQPTGGAQPADEASGRPRPPAPPPQQQQTPAVPNR